MEKAVDTYGMLCIAGTWLPNTDKGGSSGRLNSVVEMVNACWNCGETGHGVGNALFQRIKLGLPRTRRL
jgi:hypothetical protein